MKSLLCLLLLSGMVELGMAQPEILWTQTYNGTTDEVIENVANRGNGFVLAGGSESPGGDSLYYYVTVVDSAGNEIWTRTFGLDGDTACIAHAATAAANGDVIMVGTAHDLYQGYGPDHIARYSAGGDLLWQKTLGEMGTYPSPYAVRELADGSLMVAGYRTDSGFNGYLTKLTADGDTIWTHVYGDNHLERYEDMDIMPDGGFVLSGFFVQSLETLWPRVIRTDADGSLLWMRDYNVGFLADEDVEVIALPGGDMLVCAIIQPDWREVMLLRLNPNGDSLWTRHFGVEGSYVEPYDMTLAPDGSVLISGTTLADLAPHSFLLNVTTDGDQLWWYDCPVAINGNPTYVACTADNGYVLATTRWNPENGVDAMLIKLGTPESATPKPLALPSSFTLGAYPNPFNAVTTITLSVPQAVSGRLVVNDILGREWAEIANRRFEAGVQRISFDAARLSSGVYFVRLVTDHALVTQKLLLLK